MNMTMTTKRQDNKVQIFSTVSSIFQNILEKKEKAIWCFRGGQKMHELLNMPSIVKALLNQWPADTSLHFLKWPSEKFDSCHSRDYKQEITFRLTLQHLFSATPCTFCNKYIGVKSWKAAHLSTLEIRVEQKRNRVKKEKK